MTGHVHSSPTPSAPSFNYPFAAAPDIIRSHQKDAYFQGILLSHLSNILRSFYGSRFIHTYTTEAHTFSDLLYLSLTTLLGNRTLGEEYCDIIQVEDDTSKLPSLYRRSGYIVTSVLLPFGLNKILPSFRSKVRNKLEKNLARLSKTKDATKSYSYKTQNYILTHLSSITSPSPLHALTLTIFYFSGAYYQLSKRLWGLRYIFTKRVEASDARVGYEVLGVLLVLQIAVQGYLHVRNSLWLRDPPPVVANAEALGGGTAVLAGGVEVSLDPNSYASNNELLFESSELPSSSTNASAIRTAKATNTPNLLLTGKSDPYRYHLTNEKTMKWISGAQQRKCTLCLEELKDPSATSCGHVFCWGCIEDWIREKPECPLCRRELKAQHVLPLRS